MELPLSRLGMRKTGKIKYLAGGIRFQTKMISLGVRVGKKIKVSSSHRFGGPVTFEIDNMEVAIGRGMAEKIIVETQ